MSTFAAVEAGGTKFRAAIVDKEMQILDEVWIPTTTPDETLGAILSFFADREPTSALGIASFGPLRVTPDSSDFGMIANTPKPHWSGAPLLSTLQTGLGIPTDIQTDVEAAAVAEYQLGAGAGHRRVGYVTLGTGVGAAIAIDGVPVRGRDHTELGHIPVRRVDGDTYPGRCPFHRDCLEGMASGPAIAERWGAEGTELDGRNDVWDLEAAYVAQLIRVYTYAYAPDIVCIGGGVGTRPGLADLIAEAVVIDEAGYAPSGPPKVVTAGLGEEAGLIGAGLIARRLVSS